MKKYRLQKDSVDAVVVSVGIVENPQVSIPLHQANTDYQRFKTEINSGEAELQDSEGVTMTAEEAKAFVATLP